MSKRKSIYVIVSLLCIISGFEYLYDVPVEKIDLTFDKPYFFLN